MNLINFAYERLENCKLAYDSELNYSAKFKGFNANAVKTNNKLIFNLSKSWNEISDEIKIGVVQELLIKILKLEKRKTINIDLYHNFLRNAHIAVPKVHTHPLLEQAFDKLNKTFFSSRIEKTNFKLSSSSTVLGSYHYGTDTITITEKLFADQELLEYVMYHEMLHKHHKFSSNKCNTLHHSKTFKEDESRFPNSQLMEDKLKKLIKSERKAFKTLLFPFW